MLEAAELMVAATDQLKPARVQQVAAERKSLLAMGYVKIANSGMVTRTAKAITLTQPEHARMAEEGVSLFKEGEAMKKTWPVEVDSVHAIVP